MPLTALSLDNAEQDCQSLSDIVNGPASAPDVITRLGSTVKPVAKVIEEIAASISGAAGYEPPVAYANGLNIIRATQTVTSGGQTYAPVTGIVPFVTGAVFDPAQWRLVLAKNLLSRAELKALGVVADGTVQLVVDGLKTGVFRFTTANIKPFCDGDPTEGLFIKPTGGDGSTGGWVRDYEGRAQARWWGVVADGVTNDGLAMIAAKDALRAIRLVSGGAVVGYGVGAGPDLHCSGHIYMGAHTLILDFALHIEGDGRGVPGGAGTLLRWDDGVSCIVVPFASGGNGWSVHNATIAGGWNGGDESESHGIDFHLPGSVVDVSFFNLGGDALHSDNDAAGGTGNANGTRVHKVFAQGCRRAIYTHGGDSNAMTFDSVNGFSNRQCCAWEAGFLGNWYPNIECEGNARTAWNTGAANRPCSYVTSGGFQYACAVGQEAWCAANAPSGTATSNTGWIYWQAGGVAVGIPAWFNGIAVRAGGGIIHTGDSNASLFSGFYQEGDETSQFDQLARVVSPIGSIGNLFLVTAGAIQTRRPVVITTLPGGVLHFPGRVEIGDTITVNGAIQQFGPTIGADSDQTFLLSCIGAGSSVVLFGRNWIGGASTDFASIGFYSSFGRIDNVIAGKSYRFRVGNIDAAILDGTGLIHQNGFNPSLTEIAAADVPVPGAGTQTLFIDTADHKLKRKDSSGTVTPIA